MRERLIIVFVAVAIGLIVTTLIFFLYQQTKTIPSKSTEPIVKTQTPAPSSPNYLVVDEPLDEALADRRLVQVKGKTHTQDTIVVSTNQEDKVVTPTSDGRFAVSITIDSGANVIVTRSIAPDGSEKKDTRVVTYSTEEF